MKIGRNDRLTFKANLRRARYGWLRLTPAYSVHQVEELLDVDSKGAVVLDPFCGTGTTALVCAERGIACDTTDINPFLVWLARVKATPYTENDVEGFVSASRKVAAAIRSNCRGPVWVPSLHQIEKWWDKNTLPALGRAMAAIKGLEGVAPDGTCDLLKVAFCRTMMDHAQVSFGHQSMSFKKSERVQESPPTLPGFDDHPVAATWEQAVLVIVSAARSPITKPPRVFLQDARKLATELGANCYTRVITSPPYPNRMSYIRELRPYMYWLGFLRDGRGAGEMDWQAIGGTWGCATSNLTKWQPSPEVTVPYREFEAICERIRARSDILSRYVRKYFIDMVGHCEALFPCVKPGGALHYIVGNSKFYDVLLPVPELFATLFEAAGFTAATYQATRKRTSKKELFEYVVSARKPASP